MLDPGDATRLPLLFSTNSRSAFYQALPATPDGKYAPPQGAMVPAGLADDDPRWTRLLPWTTVPDALTDPKNILAVAGLALLNVVIPLLILRLAARQRRWTVRVLMALPVAAAIPLMALNYLEPMLADRTDPLGISPRLQFALGTLAGVPIVAFAAVALLALIRRRWQRMAALSAITRPRFAHHRGTLDLVRHEVDAGNRALRPGGLVPDLNAGCLRGRSDHANPLGGQANRQTASSKVTKFVTSAPRGT